MKHSSMSFAFRQSTIVNHHLSIVSMQRSIQMGKRTPFLVLPFYFAIVLVAFPFEASRAEPDAETVVFRDGDRSWTYEKRSSHEWTV